jgi:hypothetical protein
MQCVITGCALIDGNRWIAGDLFDAGAYWVFNGNYDHETRQSEWNSGEPHYGKRITLDGRWMEKRGIFFLPKDDTQLNQAAIDYISG